ncbi:MAG: amino acid ABC transporter substrate-binding protein [Deltaproteobacteria bacterium]|nr:amino acid ABC transporter substrate-binding protein [Deltaproteobacteria bacterium]
MGKRILWALALLTAVFILTNATYSMAAEKIYINGIDANFPPFAYVDKKGNADGFDVKALDWIAKEMGFKVEHKPMDWDGIIPSLRAKKIDIIASGMSITDKRKEQVNFTIPYWNIAQVIVAPKDSTATVDELLSKGNKIGVQRGTTEARWIKENLIAKGKNFSLVEYDSAPLSVEDVLNGRIKGAAMDDAPAKDAVNKKPVRIVGTFGMPSEDFGYAVRKEDSELLKKLDEGLKKLMASPYWNELKRKYNP